MIVSSIRIETGNTPTRLLVAPHQGATAASSFSPALAGFLTPSVMENSKRKKDVPTAEELASNSLGPIKVFRQDDVSVSVFARTSNVKGKPVTFHSASFSRAYKDASGAWRYAKTFDPGDLGKVMALAKQASDFIQAERGLVLAVGED